MSEPIKDILFLDLHHFNEVLALQVVQNLHKFHVGRFRKGVDPIKRLNVKCIANNTRGLHY